MFITNPQLLGRALRTTAAAVLVAAVVASCASSTRPVTTPASADPPVTELRTDPATAGEGAGMSSAVAGRADPVAAMSVTSETSLSETSSSPSETSSQAVHLASTAASDTDTSLSETDTVSEGEPTGGTLDSTEPANTTSADSEVKEVRVQAADPVAIRIPAIKVNADIIGLGLNDDGTIEVPAEADLTGWWRGGPEPGEKGPAVILGHIDSRVGPAVFYRLRDLQPGDLIHVDRKDGTSVSYVVETSEQHAKDDFPTQAVYGPTDDPTLRLITCGGQFDRDVRSYEDNFIVFASIA